MSGWWDDGFDRPTWLEPPLDYGIPGGLYPTPPAPSPDGPGRQPEAPPNPQLGVEELPPPSSNDPAPLPNPTAEYAPPPPPPPPTAGYGNYEPDGTIAAGNFPPELPGLGGPDPGPPGTDWYGIAEDAWTDKLWGGIMEIGERYDHPERFDFVAEPKGAEHGYGVGDVPGRVSPPVIFPTLPTIPGGWWDVFRILIPGIVLPGIFFPRREPRTQPQPAPAPPPAPPRTAPPPAFPYEFERPADPRDFPGPDPSPGFPIPLPSLPQPVFDPAPTLPRTADPLPIPAPPRTAPQPSQPLPGPGSIPRAPIGWPWPAFPVPLPRFRVRPRPGFRPFEFADPLPTPFADPAPLPFADPVPSAPPPALGPSIPSPIGDTFLPPELAPLEAPRLTRPRTGDRDCVCPKPRKKRAAPSNKIAQVKPFRRRMSRNSLANLR